MQCHVALSQEAHPEAAAQAVAVSVYEALGQAECHLAFVFFSPHYSSDIQRMVDIIHENLRPQVLVGCMGQGVIGGDQEIEEHPGLVL